VLITLIAMIVILVVAGAVIGMVFLGLEGIGQHRLPEVAGTLAKAGAHLNGEAAPPAGLVTILEEAEAGAVDLKALPAAIRARRSAKSAGSASSAASSTSGASASSITSASSASEPVSVDPPTTTLRRPAVPAPAERPDTSLNARPSGSVWDSLPTDDATTRLAPLPGRSSGNAWASWSAD